ncbi:non-ribosomal peptide synthetase [Erwinia tasmaniensis]|uniref:Similar to bacitracin synthetase 1 (BA1), protein contains non-ribosomal peptide synthetase modules n=1 Tax=Erwinia tasmaniensis (strain DSM 17950 / CFBP 7177 / CIP 109463 / NCPPB 4357 / Et1/99) TaxID=465817 RepID=B2VDC5_ERWT9|nr:non-ribosomal peptide synthetase [Erwinia tasmaniensis]CAO97963.1 Similar to bacitracin synthetase 1 (BA1), protein contains non-ribosomal peptide synthetase modules [Erwinia tasmaniensis Et1/99]
MELLSVSPYTMMFWNENILNPESSEYNLIVDQTIIGPLDVERLNIAIKKFVSDYPLFHHVLSDNNEQLHWVKSEKEITLEIIDKNCDIAGLVSTPFDLTQGPLCRFYLTELGYQRHDFIIVIHHVLLDGLSGQEFYDTLSRYYNQGAQVLPPAYSPAQQQQLYKQYANDVERLKNEFDSASLWHEILSDCPPRIDLPYIHCQSNPTCRSGEVRFSLALSEWHHLKSSVKYANPFLIFKTLWALLMARHTGQQTVYVGYPVAAEGGEPLYFGAQVNTAVFPLRLSAQDTFASLYQATLDYTKALKAAGKLRHTRLPVDEIISQSQIKQLNVNLTQAFLKDSPLTFEGCRMSINHRFNIDLAGSELLLEYQQSGEAFDFRLRYRADLFDETQMQEMAEQYIYLLRSLLHEPRRVISTFPYLTQQQELSLWDRFNSGDVQPSAQNNTLLCGFEKYARLHPERIALKNDKEEIGYGELEHRTTRLAQRLRWQYQLICGQPMPADTLIPLYLHRGLDAIVALLAIMKAGAAYVPLDPAAPVQRLAYILQDVGSPLVLTESALLENIVHNAPDSACLLIDRPESPPFAENIALPVIDSRQLAYVIYTSGTTGRPKGVLCEHRGAANMIQSHTRRILAGEDGVLNCMQFASLAFDAHVYEVFTALENGHCLCITNESQRLDLTLLTEQMASWQINFCFLPPALLTTRPELPDSVRYLGVGGEAATQDVLDHYLANGLRVSNLYGPTEGSVSVSINLYRHNGARNIGRPIAHMQCYVVDEHFNPLPLGVEGELYLSGIGLARGYLGQPELTASTFTVSPFNHSAEYGRVYRTGDRVRRLACGSLEYCGRKDQQVKIHGYRIELGEIESVMRSLPGIAEAVVVARKDPSPQLQAWYVLAAGSNLIPREIVQQLSAQLPHYMVPDAMAAIPAIPLTVSQKVDYRALPEPTLIEQTTSFRAPTNPLENQLLIILNQLLNSNAGIDDHFYHLGGNSILAIRLCHEINKQLGVKISALTLNQYPTIAELSHYIALQEQDAGKNVIPATKCQTAPLSFQQSRLWFMEQLSTGAAHYLSPVLLRLPADVDRTAFIKSLQAVVARHQVLRSLIKQDQKGEACQIVTDQVLSVPVHGVTADEFTSCLQNELRQPIDLTHDIPLRAALYQYQDETGSSLTVSLLVFHHIAFDGWSMNVLMKELAEHYHHFVLETARQPSELGLQYLDYALWQHQQGEEAGKADDMAFWHKALADCQQLDIAPDYVRPAAFDTRGDNCNVMLPAPLVTSLALLAREEGVSLHAVMLSAFTLLLARFTGQNDVMVGTPLANRGQPELENLIGFFVNTLPLRNRVDDELSTSAFIRQVATNTLQAQQHQSLSLEQLVDSLALQRDFSRHPLFQVMFALEESINRADNPSCFTVMDLSGYEQTAKFDLTLTITPEKDRMRARFNFATALFKKSSISQLASYFVSILQNMVTNHHNTLKNISISSSEDMQQLISFRRQQPFEYSFERTLHHDFMLNARQRPQAVAVIDRWGEMTYGELYQAALTLASQLRLQGEIQGEAIAVLAEKGRQQPIAILAALMCGRAFLPMDKGWPPQRRLDVMAQAGINTLLSTEVWETAEINVVTLDGVGRTSSLPEPERLLSPVGTDADSLAYIIFTSGSTGTPKGVAIEHRSVVNMIEGTNRYFAVNGSDRSIALSALSFDLAIYDIFSVLSTGGAVVMPAECDRANPEAWYQLMIAHRVTLWLSAPALLELLLDYVNSAGLLSGPAPALRAVMVGGDWIATSLPERCRQWAPESRVCSAGGATEAAVFSIIYEVPNEPVLSVSIPYGKPLPHQRFYIMDSWLRPVPDGVKGEIYIAGEGLARGYYGDKERTANSFFWHEPLQERVYRTGDSGRFLSDGNIEFMGRIDQQVKINGYRIELGEIENIVLAYPTLTACSVILIKQPHPYLAAYLVSSEPLDISALSAHLRSQLPQYMMPRAFVQLDSIPLTENGKIDRKALPEPQYEQRDFVAAASVQESECCEVWCALLKRQSVSVEDNFFSLGGNSILAIQACYQISRRLRRDVTLSELGQHPTIRELCHYLNNTCEDAEMQAIPALHLDSYPLSSSQMQLWFIENLNGGSHLYHVPMLFRLSEEVDAIAYCQSLQTIVARHHVLRSTICQQQDLTATSRLSDADLRVASLTLDTDDWQRQLLQDIDRPFRLDVEIPLRASLYQVRQPDDTTERYSLIVVHHLAFDGWSQNLFQQELATLYKAYRRGEQPSLPALPLQYGDYASWQQTYLDSEKAGALKAFWQQQLHDWQMLEMPLDYVRPTLFDHHGANHHIRLPKALAEQAERFVQHEGVTPFALFLSAFNLLLSCFSGQQDILVGTPVANRPTGDTRSAIGFFVNTLPLRTRIDDNLLLSDYVRETFNVSLEAQKYQSLPLERLIDLLKVPRDLSRHPLFQVLFVLEDVTQNSAQPDWLITQSLMEHYQAAKFDLTLSIQKEGECTQAVFNYATALFAPETIDCLSQYYLTILEQIVGQSDLRINQLRLVSAVEIADQRKAWQSSPPAYDYERAIHHDFIRQAQQQPQAVAIIDSLGTLSYGELYHAALNLSLQLRQNMDMSGETIAVMVDKGRAQIIAVLAIVMSGKAYLPLDVSWPERRRLDVIAQSQTRVIISSQPWQESDKASLLLIDPCGVVATLPAAQPGEPVLPAPGELAYVIFTSGSTGTPKGVAVEHRGAVNSIVDTVHQLDLDRGDRGLALSALSFDISAFDIFGILSIGGTMVMPSESERYRPDAWHQLILDHGVTFWNSAPSVMTLLVEYLESVQATGEGWPTLRTAILVGEIIPKQLPPRIRQWSHGCRVVSTGGATESSIWSIIYDIPDTPILGPSIPYGKAMAHQRFYVLDRHMRVLPPCLPGEQYIGGAGVARGYFRNKSITQERFIYHPELGEKLYRTGDAGRYLPDGNLEFMGRMDFQVKINGYRVELGEVENSALAFGLIKSCCAIVWKDHEQERLALYYVCSEPLIEAELLEFLSQRLPLYMIPTALIALEALPYNSSGKLDRKALPAPQKNEQSRYVAPSSTLEQQLCSLWQETLKRDRVGMTDDFFSLGGTSIMAISACIKLSELLKTTVPVVKLFQCRTLKNLLAAHKASLVIPLTPVVSSLPTLWMIHPALAGAEVFHPFAQDLKNRMNSFGVDNYHLYHRPAIASLSALADRYLEEMIENGLLTGPIKILGWSLGGLIALEIAARLEARGINDVSLYLLDSFYQQSVKEVSLATLLPALGITGKAAERALAAASVEDQLSQAVLSSKLNTTRVTLFKAMLANPDLPDDVMRPLMSIPDNGLKTVCEHLTVIPLACHHHNILECGGDIRGVICSSQD